MAHHPVRDPRPASDAKAALQRESLAALYAILPHDRMILRDERVEDMGVDASLEVVDCEKGTNYRAQLQLKGRRGLAVGKNGAVSLQVPTANTNYLLNGTCPIYVLYRAESRELRYAFARDEIERIECDTPKWREQKSIKIHFLNVLDSLALQSIAARIADEARLYRVVHDKLVPLQDLVWGLDKILTWLRAALSKRLADTCPEDVQAPAPHIAGPALLHLSFAATQEHLREMYANLLATAMKKASADEAHPAFTQIIQQLSPDEAIVLHKIAMLPGEFSLSERVHEDWSLVDATKNEYIHKQFEQLCINAGVANPRLSSSYLDNLVRLKLLTEDTWAEGKFQPTSSNEFGDVDAHVENVTGRSVRLSAFGEHFLRVRNVSTRMRQRLRKFYEGNGFTAVADVSRRGVLAAA